MEFVDNVILGALIINANTLASKSRYLLQRRHEMSRAKINVKIRGITGNLGGWEAITVDLRASPKEE